MPASCATCGKLGATAYCGRCKIAYYCNNKCQRADWKVHKKMCNALAVMQKKAKKPKHQSIPKYESPLFKVVSIKNKGLGMIAKRNIAAGTCIVSELPLLAVIKKANPYPSGVVPPFSIPDFVQQLFKQYNSLSETQKQLVDTLSYHATTAVDDSVIEVCELFLRFQSNSIGDQAVGSTFKGLYPTISRINHSCNSNCIQAFVGESAEPNWTELKQSETNIRCSIISVRDIAKGEEITFSYLGKLPGELSAQRIDALRRSWNFKCDCAWCLEPERAAMDKWIAEYHRLNTQIPLIQNPKVKYEAVMNMVKLIEQHFESHPHLMYVHCSDLAECAFAVKQWKVFEEAAVNATKYFWIVQGDPHGKKVNNPQVVLDLLPKIPRPDIAANKAMQIIKL